MKNVDVHMSHLVKLKMWLENERNCFGNILWVLRSVLNEFKSVTESVETFSRNQIFWFFYLFQKSRSIKNITRVTISPYAVTWCQKSRLPKQKWDSGNDFEMINVFNTCHGSFQILFWCFQNSLEEMWGHFLNNFQDVYKWEDEITCFLRKIY